MIQPKKAYFFWITFGHQGVRWLLSILFLIPMGWSAMAQQSYLSIGAAYAFGTNGITHNMFEQSTINGNDITVTAKKLTLGTGLNYKADYRFFFNDFLGIGVQGTLVRGSWQHFAAERKIVYIQRTYRSARMQGFSLAGAIHGRIGDQDVMPYFSLMPGFFMGSLELADTIRYSDQETSSRWKYTDLNSLYLAIAAGVDVVIHERVNLFVEAEIQNMTLAPRHAHLLIKDGLDDLEEIPVNEKEILFMDVMTSDYTQMPDPTKPQRSLKPFFPMDNFQLRLGIRITF